MQFQNVQHSFLFKYVQEEAFNFRHINNVILIEMDSVNSTYFHDVFIERKRLQQNTSHCWGTFLLYKNVFIATPLWKIGSRSGN